ncbi:unnamed protein product, partial [Rotaria magnacalcarata]
DDSFGTVSRVKDKENNLFYALKTIPKKPGNKSKASSVDNEVKLLTEQINDQPIYLLSGGDRSGRGGDRSGRGGDRSGRGGDRSGRGGDRSERGGDRSGCSDKDESADRSERDDQVAG